MDIAKWAIEKKVISWLTVLIVLVGGAYSFEHLGRLEDPEFTIKEAMVYTLYPGASPLEVEEEVTDRIETAIQQLAAVDEIRSKSYPGVSEITVEIKDHYKGSDLPQVWDELRRKVNDVQKKLPPGTSVSLVNDDFGDVYGIYYALTGEGYSYAELNEYAKFLRKKLLLVPNVAKVVIGGRWDEQIFVEISNARLGQLGISPSLVYQTLESQNLVSPAGEVKVGQQSVRIATTGEFANYREIEDLIIQKPGTHQQIYLKDIATITRDYQERPQHLIHFNGKPALTLGISIAPGGNVVTLGQDIDKTLKTLEPQIPAGLQVSSIYHQPTLVENSVNNFAVNLYQAVAIVVAVLLLSMGLRSGLIIGSILFLTIFATFIFMLIYKIDLQRISLGALIIALGMLVDNAIVVAEGILVRMQQGENPIKASSRIVKQTIWPLLGATVVGIIAFAPIGLSNDSTGEFCSSLFYVILISLMLSWYFAITLTPLFCAKFLKVSKTAVADPYGGLIYRIYKGFLRTCIKLRYVTILALVGLLAFSMYSFGYVKQSFFPDSTTPIFYANIWNPQGTDIRQTKAVMEAIEKEISQFQHIKNLSTFIGQGPARFTLTFAPEQPNTSYGQFLIEVDDFAQIAAVSQKVQQYITQNHSDVDVYLDFMRLGPGGGAKIEARFTGPDPKVLRQLSDQTMDIMYDSKLAINIRDDWRQRVKIIRPQYSETKGRNTGITRADLNQALAAHFSGQNVSVYRERDELIPIVMRAPANERLTVSSIQQLQIWSPIAQSSIPIGQVVNGFTTEWEDQLVRRENRIRTMTTMCDPRTGLNANDVFNTLRPQIEAIQLPTGYKLEWGGEYEDSRDAQAALTGVIILGLLTMIVIIIVLFNAIRQPLIIWLTVPLAIIGVTWGLLGTQQSFGFMSLLGLLSLTGMLIKNAIVLLDQIDLEIREGKEPLLAVLDSAVGRARPVILAACTTVLGMIPLLSDVFFVSMAVTIMAGLAFATLLTLVFVPVLYTVFFRIKYEPAHAN